MTNEQIKDEIIKNQADIISNLKEQIKHWEETVKTLAKVAQINLDNINEDLKMNEQDEIDHIKEGYESEKDYMESEGLLTEDSVEKATDLVEGENG